MKYHFKSGKDRENYFFKPGHCNWVMFYKLPLPMGFTSRESVVGSVWEQMGTNTDGVLL